jgi:hypothetical protein
VREKFNNNEFPKVKKSIDEFKGMLTLTKSSVDDLLPTSEQLLSQTKRQERAITDIRNDLNEKTNVILEGLSEVIME